MKFDAVSVEFVLKDISGPSIEYKKRLLLRYEYKILNRDLIHNMDHMRISGTEPSSVILSHTK